MCKSDSHNANIMQSASILEATTVGFHFPTLLQSILASAAILIFAILFYYSMRYMGYCNGHNFELRQREYTVPPAYAPPLMLTSAPNIQPDSTGMVGQRKEFQ